ncbi:iron-hydroxamate ABC transporter substrate-binding protein [Virgibacillus sp. NKC19-16]|uniref:iron-hydroxamate ABC transporter substrate-binding protein n=1 Tax=Virgibacillus salidurans TaxID=2831673 RepID=UPI001F2FE638|nr:iron-hydroxamate ABC transporter substrate-binding protein [Virgibacillus sp. NKC19-16]UJL45131.1 iron-hydroxamate ABC transporter substrate-binding protein [Virgibacillus sp. NKC19-16]
MYSNYKSHLIFIVMAFGLLLFISACGDDDSTSEPDTDTSGEVTVDSEMGEVSIPESPSRILAPFHEDAMLALGVTPVAKWSIGEQIQNYLEDDLQDIPSIEWSLPLEQVLSHEPDLIILENNMESYEGTYEDYNEIAPTYVMTEETTKDWRNQIETFGKMLGKENEAETVLNEYEEKVNDASEQLDEALGDETIAAIWATGDQFFLFEEDRHSAEVLYSEVGINAPALVEELGAAETQWNPISLEALSELEADHVFLLAEEGEQGIETLENSSVWQSTPAAENGNIYMINDPSNWTNTGVIAAEQTIDDVLNALGI